MNRKDPGFSSPMKARRVKDTKDIQQLIELVLKNVISEKGYQTKKQMESFVEKLVQKSLADICKRIAEIESKVDRHVTSIEVVVEKLNRSLSDIQKTHDDNRQTTQKDLARLEKEHIESVDDTKKKNLTLIKKIYKKQKDDTEILNGKVFQIKNDQEALINSFIEDVRLHSKELSKLRDLIDEMRPSAGRAAQMANSLGHAGFSENSFILDQLNSRMNTLERHCYGNEHLNGSTSQGLVTGSPLSSRKSRQFDHRKAQLHHPSHDPSGRNGDIYYDDEIREIKLTLEVIEAEIGAVRDIADEALSKSSKGCGNDVTKEREKLLEDLTTDLKAIKQKVRGIGESTSQSCQTLAASVSDMQQSTLNIYAWADRAHTAFGVVSEKLNLRPNVCPRIYAHNISPERRSSAEFLDNLAVFNKASSGTSRGYRW